jgi:hypothetical protein
MLHISDPKFQIIVKRTGRSIATVAAVWSFFNCNQAAKKRDLVCGIELQACDNFFSITDGSSKEILDLLFELEIFEAKKKRVDADRMVRLPSGFYPNETGVIKAEELGVNIAIELTKFTDYHNAKASKMADWQAAWRTWVGNAAKFRGSAPQNRQVLIEERNKAAGLEWLKQQGV